MVRDHPGRAVIWSFVLVPDTQYLATPANGWTSYFNGLRDWIIDNADVHNIRFIGGLGDIVDLNGDTASWANAKTALTPLFDLDIPVLLFAAGNHDTDEVAQPSRDHDLYNATFPEYLYQNESWFGGVYETGNAQNMYARTDIGAHKYLLFALEFYPRDGVLDWVSDVVAAHPDDRVVIVTHAYLHDTGARDTWATTPYGADTYFTEGVDDANPGDDMWTGWFTTFPNLCGVFNGHYIGGGNVAYDLDTGTAGNTVLQGFYNWQQSANGGAGRVVLMTVDDVAGTIRHRVVRTDTDTFESGTNYDVTHQVWTATVPAAADLSAVDVAGTLHTIDHAGLSTVHLGS